ncbi:hypothetical protein [Consotaella aegiceratis]|uniref:hypothetical protein n=1 Tax=Consotaella aegiceratis TaxID=3097961 RepID=UPI002F3EEF67
MRFTRIVIGGVLCAAVLTGCTTTEDANLAIQSQWMGQPSDAFFAQYGPPASQFALNDGGTIYTWRGGDTERSIAAQYRPMTESEKKHAKDGPRTVINIGSDPAPYVPPGQVLVSPARTEQLGCEAQIATNADGIITSIRTSRDTDGQGFSFSRCAEVFGVE